MKFGSVCSGIEAASCAWEPLGWKASFFSEIEPFPRSALTHHYPAVPLHGDFTTIKKGQYDPIDVLVGGTPCQSFSVAGLRKGLDDPRGNLMLGYLALADKYRPRWLVWENVPGVLSSNGGRDFGTFLGGLGQLGYGFAYRVLDAQYFGVPQRRRRVFVVGCLGDWRRAAAVLFERESLCGNPPPSRQAGQSVASTLKGGAGTRGYPDPSDGNGGGLIRWPAQVASTLNAAFGKKLGLENQHINEGAPLFVPHLLGGIDNENNGFGPDAPTGPLMKDSPTGGGRPLPAVVYGIPGNVIDRSDDTGGNGQGFSEGVGYTLTKCDVHAVALTEKVRRLTPVECERLQGFRDNWTLVPHNGKPAADGNRYKALGNSMAVPVMAWLGERIQAVESLAVEQIAA